MNRIEKAQVITIISNRYTVVVNHHEYVAVAMGKLRKQKSPVVGDFVEIEFFSDQIGIQKIYPRFNELRRPSIANVDQAVIVMSMVDPNFSTTLIDRLIFMIVLADIQPVLVITKTDKVPETYFGYQAADDYQRAGYSVFLVNPESKATELIPLFEDKVSVLTGQSGAGKSTLLNKLNPDFELATQEPSKALGRGKHTTRHTQLYAVAGGYVADTPGFSSMDFSTISAVELSQKVPDFKPFLGQCKYANCIHHHEPGCRIKQAVHDHELSKDRYDHYIECLNMIEKEY